MVDQIAIEIENLSKRYGYNYALRDVTLNILQGEVFVFLGPNGSGKTTLLKILTTLTSLTSGNVKVFGLALRENGREIRQMIGYLSHEPLLYRDLTGEENINFYSKFYQLSSQERFQEKLDKAFNFLRITRWRHEPIKNLSKGLKKRFDLVRAIIHDPKILLLDEPFSGLDILSVNILKDFIRNERGNKTTIISTHDIDLAKSLCDRGAILVEGKMRQVLRSQDITNTSVKEIFERSV
ncbi:MAG: ABC transporter ATP-binding protein [Candidatus Bathyarchaeia archaeon]